VATEEKFELGGYFLKLLTDIKRDGTLK